MAYPSTFLDIQNSVITRTRMSPTADLQRVKDWINQVYTQVCVETESTVTSATMNLTAGSYQYTLPAGVARIKQMYLTPAGQTSVMEQPPLILTTLDDLLQKRRSGGVTQQAGSYSTHYTLVGANDYELWPTPAAIDVVTIYYAAFPTALSGDTDVPALDEPYASNLLTYGALGQAGDWKGDPASQEWQGLFAQWMGAYQNHLEQKKGDVPIYGHSWGRIYNPYSSLRG